MTHSDKSDSENQGPAVHSEIEPFGSSLIGRDDILETLVETLATSETPLHSLTGPTGIGKSHLSAKIIDTLSSRDNSPFDTYYAFSAASSQSAEQLMFRLGSTVGAPLHLLENMAQLRDFLINHFTETSNLVVIDDLPELDDAALSFFTAIGEQAQTVFLLTTESSLKLDSIIEHNLEPLSEPAARRLYRNQINAARQDYELPDEQLDRLVELLDYRPLSIILAARRFPLLSPLEPDQRPQEQIKNLKSKTDADSPIGLEENLERMWELLSPIERLALVQLSLFEANWPLHAAEEVLDLSATGPRLNVSQVIQNLLTKGLLLVKTTRDAIAGRSTSRFRLMKAVRAFAWEKFQGLDSTNPTTVNFVDYWVDRTSKLGDQLESSPQLAARLFSREAADIFTTFEFALHDAPAKAARIADHISGFSQLGPFPRDSKAFFRASLKALRSAEGSSDPTLKSRLNYHMVRSTWADGDQPGLIERYRDVIEVAEKTEDITTLVNASIKLARAHSREGNSDDAIETLEYALDTCVELGHARLRGHLLLRLGSVYSKDRERLKAIESFERALTQFESASDPSGNTRTYLALCGEMICVHRNGEADHYLSKIDEQQLEEPGNLDLRLEFAILKGQLNLLRDKPERALRIIEDNAINLSYPRLSAIRYSLKLTKVIAQIGLNRYSDAEAIAKQITSNVSQDSPQTSPHLYAKGWALIAKWLDDDGDSGQESFQQLLDQAPRRLPFVRVLKKFRRAVELFDPGQLSDSKLEDVESIREAIKSSTEPTLNAETRSSLHSIMAAKLLGEQLNQRLEEHSALTLTVEQSQAAWFQVGSEEPVDISTRGAFKRVLQALVSIFDAEEESGLDKYELFEAGWPDDEDVSPQTASARVYHAISSLRDMGLEDILLRDDRGYYLDPGIKIKRDDNADEP